MLPRAGLLAGGWASHAHATFLCTPLVHGVVGFGHQIVAGHALAKRGAASTECDAVLGRGRQVDGISLSRRCTPDREMGESGVFPHLMCALRRRVAGTGGCRPTSLLVRKIVARGTPQSAAIDPRWTARRGTGRRVRAGACGYAIEHPSDGPRGKKRWVLGASARNCAQPRGPKCRPRE
jgi:hypothetical protein